MAAAVALVALVVAACSGGSGVGESTVATVATNEPQADGGGWGLLAGVSNEVERFDSLAEMGKMADVVLIAQARGVDGVRRVGPEGAEGIDLARVRFEVVRALPRWDEDSIVVDFFLPSSEAMADLEEQVGGFPPTLLALREKADEEAGSYRLVNSQSLWTDDPGGGVVAPLGDEVQLLELAPEVAEIEDLEDLGDHLEAPRRDCDPACGRSQAEPHR